MDQTLSFWLEATRVNSLSRGSIVQRCYKGRVARTCRGALYHCRTGERTWCRGRTQSICTPLRQTERNSTTRDVLRKAEPTKCDFLWDLRSHLCTVLSVVSLLAVIVLVVSASRRNHGD